MGFAQSAQMGSGTAPNPDPMGQRSQRRRRNVLLKVPTRTSRFRTLTLGDAIRYREPMSQAIGKCGDLVPGWFRSGRIVGPGTVIDMEPWARRSAARKRIGATSRPQVQQASVGRRRRGGIEPHRWHHAADGTVSVRRALPSANSLLTQCGPTPRGRAEQSWRPALFQPDPPSRMGLGSDRKRRAEKYPRPRQIFPVTAGRHGPGQGGTGTKTGTGGAE